MTRYYVGTAVIPELGCLGDFFQYVLGGKEMFHRRMNTVDSQQKTDTFSKHFYKWWLLLTTAALFIDCDK